MKTAVTLYEYDNGELDWSEWADDDRGRENVARQLTLLVSDEVCEVLSRNEPLETGEMIDMLLKSN